MATKKNRPVTKVREKADNKRVYFKQSDFPMYSLQEAQRIATALVDNFGDGQGSPPNVALDIGISPTSSAWQHLAGSALAYGLTDGGSSANVLNLTALGHRLVAPETEGDDIIARREAILFLPLLLQFSRFAITGRSPDQ